MPNDAASPYAGAFTARTSAFSITGASARSSPALAMSAAARRPVRCACLPASSAKASKMAKVLSSKRIANHYALAVDVRGTRVPFTDSLEFSNEPWLASTHGGHTTRLARVPGGGASVDFLDAINPTAYGSSIYWMRSSGGDDNVSQIHRYNRTLERDERIPTTIPGEVTGFAYDAGGAYYAVPSAAQPSSCAPT